MKELSRNLDDFHKFNGLLSNRHLNINAFRFPFNLNQCEKNFYFAMSEGDISFMKCGRRTMAKRGSCL